MTMKIADFAAPASVQAIEPQASVAAERRWRIQCLSEWARRIRERRQLRRLSSRELADFMCSSADAKAEADKWFWQP